MQDKILNIHELTKATIDELEALRKDPRRLNVAETFFNGVGKVVGLIKVETEYRKARGEKPQQPFIDDAYIKQLTDGGKQLTHGEK